MGRYPYDPRRGRKAALAQVSNGAAVRNSPVKQQRLADQVVDGIRALIAEETYKVGDRLPPEPELCEHFGVGRSTIREAMRVLGNRGLVRVRQGEGTFVASASALESFEERLGRAAIEDLYEARLLLELPMAELAAERRSRADVAKMRTCLKARAAAIAARDAESYARHDFAFHLAVAKATRNAALYGMYESFVDVALTVLRSTMTAEYVRSETDDLHERLCEAIAAGDVAETRRLVVSHLGHSLKKTTGRSR